MIRSEELVTEKKKIKMRNKNKNQKKINFLT